VTCEERKNGDCKMARKSLYFVPEFYVKSSSSASKMQRKV